MEEAKHSLSNYRGSLHFWGLLQVRRGFGLPGGLQVVFQVGIVGGEAAELPVVVAQAVSHAMALVVALRGLGAEARGRGHDLGYLRALPREICPFVVGFAPSGISIACRQIAAYMPLPCRPVVRFPL